MIYRPDVSVREARSQYYADNGLPPDGGESQAFARADFGPLVLFVPNFAARRAALARHDLHHIALDADTSLRGEAIVGGWEVGSGCGRFWVAWFLEPQAMAWGLIRCPKRTLEAFAMGRRSRSLYTQPFGDNWLDVTVSDLRRRLLPDGPTAPSRADLALFVPWAVLGISLLALSLAGLLLFLALVAYAIFVLAT